MKYTWRSALVDAVIAVAVVLLFGVGFHFSESGPNGRETGLISQVCIAFYIYTIATVFLLSHFFPSGSGFLYTANVLCCKVMIPPHEGGGITWGLFGYVVGTAGLIFAFIGEGDRPAKNQAEQGRVAKPHHVASWKLHEHSTFYTDSE